MITIRDAIFERWEPVLRSLAQIPDQHPHRRPVTMDELWQIASAALVRAEEAEAAIVEWAAANLEVAEGGGYTDRLDDAHAKLESLAARIREGREKGAQA